MGKLKERTRAYLQRDEVSADIDKLAETLLEGTPHGLRLSHLGRLLRKPYIQICILIQL